MATLYELTDEFRQLLDMMEDPDVDPEVLQDTMDAIEGEFEVKAEGYAIAMGELKTKKEQIIAEVKRLNKWADALEANIERMNSAVMDAMDAIGKKKVETEHFRLSIVGNGGKRPLKITDKVPENYMRMKPEIDTSKIRQELEDGKELSFAYLADRGRRLSVR